MDNYGDLDKINSATKYPSILTYHEMGQRGRLTHTVLVSFEPTDDLVVTEKVDGTNTRMIFLHGGQYIIGSREELLYHSGDRIHNPTMGIVDALKDIADRFSENVVVKSGGMLCIYGEVYGGKIGKGAKNYTGENTVGYRMFDMSVFSASQVSDLKDKSREDISIWRKNDGQFFVGEDTLAETASAMGVGLTPRYPVRTYPPKDLNGTLFWMRSVQPEESSGAMLDDKGKGLSEGIVLRTGNRSKIAKFRFEDYHRTLK